jgi:hypothetical protein
MPQPARADKASRGGGRRDLPAQGQVALPARNCGSVSRWMRGSAAAVARAASVL